MKNWMLSWMDPLGWTLLHFLWQGVAIAFLFAISQWALRHRSAHQRYLAGCLALSLMLSAPLVTFSFLARTLANSTPLATLSRTSAVLDEIPSDPPAFTFPDTVESGSTLPVRSDSAASIFQGRISGYLPWLVSAWAAGVFILALRWLAGCYRIGRLKRHSANSPETQWLSRLESLKAQMAISRPIQLLQSAWVEVPAVIGYLRPVILLPVSAVTGLSSIQLELLLAHELAHIRRHDYLVNLLQSLVEIVLFYHPAVWWISARVRQERENCCDDLAVAYCGNRVEYVRALAAMEELRGLASTYSIGAKGGSLLARVRRLLNQPDPMPGQAGWWITGIILLLFGACTIIGSRSSALAEDQQELVAKTNVVSSTLPEPGYQGKPLSAWLDELVTFTGDRPRAFGRNVKDSKFVIPALIEIIQGEDEDAAILAAHYLRYCHKDIRNYIPELLKWMRRQPPTSRVRDFLEQSLRAIDPTVIYRLQFRVVAKDTEDPALSDEYPDPYNAGGKLRVMKKVLMTESSVDSASVERHPVTGDLEVSLKFTDYGAMTFANITATNIMNHIAVIFDGRLLCAPRVMGRIPSGKCSITGNFDLQEATVIANALNKTEELKTEKKSADTPLGKLMEEAQQAHDKAHFDVVEARYNEVLCLDENNVTVLSRLAQAQLARLRFDAAESNLSKALRLEPDDAMSLRLWGLLKLYRRKYDEALEALNRSAQQDPKNAETQHLLGFVLGEKGHQEAAIAAYHKSLELDPKNTGAHYNLASQYAAQNPPQLTKARYHYNMAMKRGYPKIEKLEKILGNKWDLQQKLKMAEAGNKWAAYELWDTYYRGNHGVLSDPAQAEKWLKEFVQDVWVVRFEPVDDFVPTTPKEFLETVNRHAATRSGQTNIGQASFFRTTKQSGKLVGSFLSNDPDQLKAALAKVPGLRVTSVERITLNEFLQYEKTRQESL